jgi:hypothetical protein
MWFVRCNNNYIADDNATNLISQTNHYHNGSLFRQT